MQVNVLRSQASLPGPQYVRQSPLLGSHAGFYSLQEHFSSVSDPYFGSRESKPSTDKTAPHRKVFQKTVSEYIRTMAIPL